MAHNLKTAYESKLPLDGLNSSKPKNVEDRLAIHLTISPSLTLNPKISANVIIRQLQNMNIKYENVRGDLVEHRWTLFNKIWESTCIESTYKMLNNKASMNVFENFELRNDNNQLIVPTTEFDNAFKENFMNYTRYFTMLYDMGTKYKAFDIDKEDFSVIISRPGAKEISYRLDNHNKEQLNMIHAITTIYVYVCDKRGKHYIELKCGDIMIFYGDCCHAISENETEFDTYAVYINVG